MFLRGSPLRGLAARPFAFAFAATTLVAALAQAEVPTKAEGDAEPPSTERSTHRIALDLEAEEPCEAPCERGIVRTSDRLALAGLRISESRSSHAEGIGVSFAGRLADYSEVGFTTTHASLYWNLGGGGAGFEGAFGGALAAGHKFRFDQAHGVVIRVGLEGYAVGDNAFYAAMFEIPQGQLAYQFLRRDALFEIGAKVGAVDVGRLRDPSIQQSRVLPFAVEIGGYTAVHFAPVRLDVAVTRYETTHDAIGTPIDLGEGTLCGFAWRFASCIDVRYERGDVPQPDDTAKSFHNLYGGLTVGFDGRTERPRDKHWNLRQRVAY